MGVKFKQESYQKEIEQLDNTKLIDVYGKFPWNAKDEYRLDKLVVIVSELEKRELIRIAVKNKDTIQMLKYFNAKLKCIRQYEDLQALVKEVQNHGFVFKLKKSGYKAYDFTDYGDGYVEYLKDDRVSIGKCKVNKLWVYMEIK